MTETVTSQELVALLNLTAKAPTTIGEANGFQPTLVKFVALANQPHPIGAIVPETTPAAAPELAGSASIPLPV